MASNYLTTLDLERHRADLLPAFKQYFEMVRQKIDEYGITTDNTYNMDEKGFLIGRLIKARRIFDKNVKGSGKLTRIR